MIFKDTFHVGIEHHTWQLARRTAELFLHLVEVVEIDVRIAEAVNKLSRLQSSDMRYHHQQQGITRDVKRNSEEQVGAALVELQAESLVGHQNCLSSPTILSQSCIVKVPGPIIMMVMVMPL